MAKKKFWTEFEDGALRALRAQGASWDDISAAFGLPVPSCMDRARAIGVGRGFVKKYHALPSPLGAEEHDDFDDRLPLPPGHTLTWGLLTAGTSLEGSTYAYQP